jgi:hypothetical protein
MRRHLLAASARPSCSPFPRTPRSGRRPCPDATGDRPVASGDLAGLRCDVTALGGRVESSPATVTTTGRTVRITAPYALGPRRGALLIHGTAIASVRHTGVIVDVSPATSAETRDHADNGIDHVLP